MHRFLNIEVRLIPGADGIFDIIADGQRVFSRSEAGRFPEPGEITRKLKLKKQVDN